MTFTLLLTVWLNYPFTLLLFSLSLSISRFLLTFASLILTLPSCKKNKGSSLHIKNYHSSRASFRFEHPAEYFHTGLFVAERYLLIQIPYLLIANNFSLIHVNGIVITPINATIHLQFSSCNLKQNRCTLTTTYLAESSHPDQSENHHSLYWKCSFLGQKHLKGYRSLSTNTILLKDSYSSFTNFKRLSAIYDC